MTKKLTVEELKQICNAIGKPGKDGKPMTEKEVRQWPSIKGKSND